MLSAELTPRISSIPITAAAAGIYGGQAAAGLLPGRWPPGAGHAPRLSGVAQSSTRPPAPPPSGHPDTHAASVIADEPAGQSTVLVGSGLHL